MPISNLGENKKTTGRTLGDEIHEFHERVEEAINQEFDKIGELEHEYQEKRHGPCYNPQLTDYVKTKIGC